MKKLMTSFLCAFLITYPQIYASSQAQDDCKKIYSALVAAYKAQDNGSMGIINIVLNDPFEFSEKACRSFIKKELKNTDNHIPYHLFHDEMNNILRVALIKTKK